MLTILQSYFCPFQFLYVSETPISTSITSFSYGFLSMDKSWVLIFSRQLLAEHITDGLQIISCEGGVIFLIFCLRDSMQIRFASLDLELHTKYVPGGSESIYDVDQRVSQKTQVIPPLPEDRFLCGFSHIFAGYFFLTIFLYHHIVYFAFACYNFLQLILSFIFILGFFFDLVKRMD